MASPFKRLVPLFKNKYLLSLAGNGIMAVVGLLTSIILRRVFTLEEMGIWLLFFSMVLLADTFRTGFLTTAFVKFFSGAEEQRADEIAGSAWYLGALITLFFLLVNIPAFLISTYVENEGIALFLKWFGIAYVLSLPFFITSCILQAKQRFDQLLVIRIFNQGSLVLFIIFFIVIDKISLNTTIYSYLLSNLLASLIALLSGWSMISKLKHRSGKAIKDLYNFGKYSAGTSISSNLLGTVDSIIISLMLGPAPLAIYDAGVRFIQFMDIPLRSFTATAMPSLANHYNKGERDKVIDVTKKYIGMLTLGMIPICLLVIIFADYAILILGGVEYVESEAPNILRIIMLIALLFPADRFMALTLDVIHQPRVNFLKVLLMLAIVSVAEIIGLHFTGSLYSVVIARILPSLTAIMIAFYVLNYRYQRFSFWSIYSVGFIKLKGMIGKVQYTK